MSQTNKPAFEVKFGNIKATAWLNQSEKGEFYSIDVTRIYKDQSGDWKRASSFGLDDLPKVEKAAAEAYRTIHQLRAGVKDFDVMKAAE